jgi:hypothetical protein
VFVSSYQKNLALFVPLHRLETGKSYKHRLETGANSGTKTQRLKPIKRFKPLLNRHIKIPQRVVQTGF